MKTNENENLNFKFDKEAEKNFDLEQKEQDKKNETPEDVEQEMDEPKVEQEKPPIDIPPEFSAAILKKGTTLLILAHSPLIKKQGLTIKDFEMTDSELLVMNTMLGTSWLTKVFELAQRYPVITAIVYFEYCFFEKLAKAKKPEII